MQTLRFSRLQRPVLSLALALIFSMPAAAQNRAFDSRDLIHGVPPSVTSFGFGGDHRPHGIPPSVTSFGFGTLPFHSNCCFHDRQPVLISPFFDVGYYAPYLPYAYPFDVVEPGVDDTMEGDYRGGPTIFDRSGAGARDYVRPQRPVEDKRSRAESSAESAESATQGNLATEKTNNLEPQPVDEQPSTVLVFRDGHQLQVSNYAIVGSTLYDLSGGRTRKVALAELDLAATVKQNDQNGVDFQLPKGVKLN